MVRYVTILFMISVSLLFTHSHEVDAQAIDIALLGDSITAGGSGVNYGVFLEDMLGEGYQVVNYGVGGACLTQRCQHAIWNTWALPALLNTEPQIVVVMLGTNDAGGTSDEVFADYETDLIAMVESLQCIDPQPQVILASPPPMVALSQQADDRIANAIIPAIERIAETYDLRVIDVYNLVDDYPANYPDELHPNEDGHKTLAVIFYDVLKDVSIPEPPMIGAIAIEDGHDLTPIDRFLAIWRLDWFKASSTCQ